MNLDSYSGATRVIFIVGDPIAQVKSPHGVTDALRERRADAIVVPAHVKPADIDAFFALTERMPNVDGIIVTVPHKFDAARLCAHVSLRARAIGAANAVPGAAGGLGGRRVTLALLDRYDGVHGGPHGVPATYHVVYAVARRR